MSRTVRAELLMLVSVAVLSGLAVPTGSEPKSSFGGVSLTTLEAFAPNTGKTQSIPVQGNRVEQLRVRSALHPLDAHAALDGDWWAARP